MHILNQNLILFKNIIIDLPTGLLACQQQQVLAPLI